MTGQPVAGNKSKSTPLSASKTHDETSDTSLLHTLVIKALHPFPTVSPSVSPSRAPYGLTILLPPLIKTSTAPDARIPEDTDETMLSVVPVTEYSVRCTRLDVPWSKITRNSQVEKDGGIMHRNRRRQISRAGSTCRVQRYSWRSRSSARPE